MKKLVTLFLISVVTLLGACATQQPTTITKYQNVIITPPKSMLTHCPLTAPPAKNVFMASAVDIQMQLLRQNDAAQMTNIKTCNDRTDNVQSWIDRELALYATDTSAVFVGQAPTGQTPLSAPPLTLPSK
jgi:hypothetical protein